MNFEILKSAPSLRMWLNGGWLCQIVDSDSGNPYPISPPFPCGGGGGGGQKQSHFMFHVFFACYDISNSFRKKKLSPAVPEALDGRYSNAPRPSVCLSVRHV